MGKENVEGSDHEDMGEAGNRLAEAVGRLDKIQYIKSATKVNAPSGGRTVRVKGLLSLLTKTSDLADVSRNLRDVSKNKSALEKPLEKRQAEKIKRSTGFEQVKANLDRWNSVVAKNRSAEYREFPLTNAEERKREPINASVTKYTIKSELELELESLNPNSGEPQQEKHFPLTMAEMIEHRKEAAQMRAKQSYKEAKARRQSKIKSKKFHRIQRKEKIKNEMKEFEELQKTNPEEALRKLELLEKTRAEERVTLRHKSTGQWAKNKLVRAKYDKDTRQELAQQLAISRELTQKVNIENGLDSEDEVSEEIPEIKVDNTSNPWLQPNDDAVEYSEYIGGYKKFWDEHNKSQTNGEDLEGTAEEVEVIESIVKKSDKIKVHQTAEKDTNIEKVIKKQKNSQSKQKIKKAISTTEWNVETSSSNEKYVDCIFDELDLQLNAKISDKLNTLKTSLAHKKPILSLKNQKKKEESELSKLSFKTKKRKPLIDEELYEETGISKASSIKDNPAIQAVNIADLMKNRTAVEIDPSKFVAPKVRHLKTTLPDAELGEDHMDDENGVDYKQMTIAQAFEDDDIVANFRQEKQDAINKDEPQIDDAFLPGWGKWTGKTLSAPRRKRKRLYANVKLPRKDDKKDNVIINQYTSEKLKKHLVSELPFPFTSVKDFESTIRAPIGNTFIPETAHKKLTQPAVTVKTGVIIHPMDESHLVDTKNRTATLPFKKRQPKRKPKAK